MKMLKYDWMIRNESTNEIEKKIHTYSQKERKKLIKKREESKEQGMCIIKTLLQWQIKKYYKKVKKEKKKKLR